MSTPDDTPPAGPDHGDPAIRTVRRHVGDVDLRTLEAGDEGRPVALLIHGLPGSAEGWIRLIPPLAREFHVVAPDRPGYALTGGAPVAAAQQADLFARLLTDLGGGPAFVVGHSYGAVIAGDLATRYAPQVQALGLLAPALGLGQWVPPIFEHAERLFAAGPSAAVLRATLLSPPGRARLAKLLVPASFAPDPVDPRNVTDTADHLLTYESLRAALFEGRYGEEASDRVAAALTTTHVPTAVIHARGDRNVPFDAGRRAAAAIPGATFRAVDGGHMLISSRADEVAPVLLELVRRRPAAGPTSS